MAARVPLRQRVTSHVKRQQPGEQLLPGRLPKIIRTPMVELPAGSNVWYQVRGGGSGMASTAGLLGGTLNTTDQAILHASCSEHAGVVPKTLGLAARSCPTAVLTGVDVRAWWCTSRDARAMHRARGNVTLTCVRSASTS